MTGTSTRITRRAVLGGVGAAATMRPGGAAHAGSRPLPGALAGAFVPWVGHEGREAGMAAWEAWLGRPEHSVPALDFWAQDSWAGFAASAWLPGFWARTAPRRTLVWSMPLTVAGTPLKAVAAGTHDADFDAAARSIASAQPAATIRLGWEMNIRTSAWFAGSDAAAYVTAFRRVAALFRAASPRFTLDWCPSWGQQDAAADLFYPGDDAVDVVGLDVYDYRLGAETAERRWADHVVAAPFGLDWQLRFAGGRGKPMSIPEWGVGEAGDNPAFVSAMRAWFERHAGAIRYACYFDVDGAWPTRLSGGQFPAARSAFRRGFGA